MIRIPLVNLRPALDETRAEWQRLLDGAMERMQWVLGPQVQAFEAAFAQAMGGRYAVGVGTGTGAIELCLRDAHVTEARQQVLTTPLTAPFTGIAILAAGPNLRFADVDPDTLLLDPNDAGNRVTRHTSAIVPVHLYGQACRLEPMVAMARERGAALVQDACQAHGAHHRGRPLTAFSPYVAYSFYPTKNLGALGDGGAVVTGSKSIAGRIAKLRDGGRRAGATGHRVHVSEVAGINSRLDEMQACYLSAFLQRLAAWNDRRARLSALYDEALAGCDEVRPVRQEPGSVHHLYVVRARNRDRLRDWLAAGGIGSAVHYPVPLHLHPAFSSAGARRGDLPHAEKAAREVLSLPLWPHLPEPAVGEVAERVRAFYKRRAQRRDADKL